MTDAVVAPRRRFVRALLGLPLVIAAVWAIAALYFSPLGIWQRWGAIGGFSAAAIAVLLWLRAPALRYAAATVLVVLVALWWWRLPPSNDLPWQLDVSVLPAVEFDGDEVVVHNIRDFVYTAEFDYTPRYRTERYRLDQLRTLDLFLVHWGSPWIAHTILSFGFDDGRQLAVSIETRKQIGQEYSAIRGFFRQFTLIYVVATERDVIGLRTDFRNEDVRLYRLQVTPDFARKVFFQYAQHINRLYERAEWYNALTENCTTSIRNDIYAFLPNKSFDWRLLLNGTIDEMLYERGALYDGLPFAELKRRSYINPVARALPPGSDYSTGIRQDLPGMR